MWAANFWLIWSSCTYKCILLLFFVANTFQIQPFHKRAGDTGRCGFLFYARSRALILIISAGCTGTPLRKMKSWTNYLMAQDLNLGKKKWLSTMHSPSSLYFHDAFPSQCHPQSESKRLLLFMYRSWLTFLDAVLWADGCVSSLQSVTNVVRTGVWIGGTGRVGSIFRPAIKMLS
jgi:hypothetical protein